MSATEPTDAPAPLSCGLDRPPADAHASAELEVLIASIPDGWSRVHIGDQSWAVTRRSRADGKVISLEAEQLGASESIGANIWLTSRGVILKPCEVPAETVMRFLRAAATTLRS